MVNLLTNLPMIAVATDTVDKNQVAQPQTYNIQRIALFTTTLGIISTVFDFFLFGLFSQKSPEILHTNWFIGSVLTDLLLIFILRTRGPIWRARFPSTTMFGLVIMAATATILLPMTTFGQNVFEFVSPTLQHLGIIASILVLYVVANELIKAIYYRFTNKEERV
ncbi:MAG: cation transporting ATPase C-terminal domain-containing protein [Candidatus Magasanikbacteria bacterium]|nr:cation transporting ATPase C-terminal domain-containing protein [Candidatus Magasanikbacteria bacterium]